jgi:hypothetical protein
MDPARRWRTWSSGPLVPFMRWVDGPEGGQRLRTRRRPLLMSSHPAASASAVGVLRSLQQHLTGLVDVVRSGAPFIHRAQVHV